MKELVGVRLEAGRRGVEVEDVVVAEEGKTLEVNIIIERESKGRTCLSLPREEMVEDIKGEEVKDLSGKTDWAGERSSNRLDRRGAIGQARGSWKADNASFHFASFHLLFIF